MLTFVYKEKFALRKVFEFISLVKIRHFSCLKVIQQEFH